MLLANIKWSMADDSFLSDFVQRHPLPHLALVTKGQYLDVGLPTMANPQLKPYLLAHSKGSTPRVVAHVARVKEGKGLVVTKQRIAIPETYKGYFEILSEDGHPTKCFESVLELAHKFPDLCVVRQSCKAYLPNSEGELTSLHVSRCVQEGEVLTLVGQFNFRRMSFLRCFDETGKSLFFKIDQKIRFSPVAKNNTITGVHTIRSLVNRRLPITVKLISGTVPSELAKITGSCQPVLRLQRIYKEDVLFAYSLQKPDGRFLILPLSAHLKLAPAANHSQIMQCGDFRKLCRACSIAKMSYNYEMVVLDDDGDQQDDGPFFEHYHTPSDHGYDTLIESPRNSFSDEDEIDQLYCNIRQREPVVAGNLPFKAFVANAPREAYPKQFSYRRAISPPLVSALFRKHPQPQESNAPCLLKFAKEPTSVMRRVFNRIVSRHQHAASPAQASTRLSISNELQSDGGPAQVLRHVKESPLQRFRGKEQQKPKADEFIPLPKMPPMNSPLLSNKVLLRNDRGVRDRRVRAVSMYLPEQVNALERVLPPSTATIIKYSASQLQINRPEGQPPPANRAVALSTTPAEGRHHRFVCRSPSSTSPACSPSVPTTCRNSKYATRPSPCNYVDRREAQSPPRRPRPLQNAIYDNNHDHRLLR